MIDIAEGVPHNDKTVAVHVAIDSSDDEEMIEETPQMRLTWHAFIVEGKSRS